MGQGRKVESTQNSPGILVNAQSPVQEGQGCWPWTLGVRWTPQG